MDVSCKYVCTYILRIAYGWLHLIHAKFHTIYLKNARFEKDDTLLSFFVPLSAQINILNHNYTGPDSHEMKLISSAIAILVIASRATVNAWDKDGIFEPNPHPKKKRKTEKLTNPFSASQDHEIFRLKDELERVEGAGVTFYGKAKAPPALVLS